MKSKVRLLLTYLLLALFMLIPAQDVSAQDEPVTIMIGSATVPSGGTVEVPMTLDPGTQLVGAITLDIVYDENILGVVNCRSIEDDENGFSACNTAEPGIIKFTVISVGGISADLRLATIEFQAVGGADVVTDVVIDSVRTLADPFFGDPIVNYTTIDGQIVVDSSALNDASAQIGSAIVEAGQTFEVPLTLDPDGEAVSVVNIDMNYDADLLAVVGCEFDESNESIIGSCYDDLSGLLSFNNAASQDAVTISTPTTLATITFKSIGFVDATTVLDIYRVETLSSFGSVLNYVDGRIVVNGEEPPDGECDGLLCEAEAGQITSEFSRFDDETASGGRYIAATGERTGDWSRPDENARVDYFVTVPEDGIYRIRVTSRERDSTYDSFFVKVDGSPAAHGYRWDVPQGSDSYATNDVSDVNGMDPVEVELTAGRHKVTFYLRTQGSSLDKFELVKVAPLFDCSGLEREAEAGSLIRGFTVGLDDVASGGAYIHVPYANASTEPDSRNKAEYCFTVEEAGVYRIKGWVHSADEGSNSFFVRMNGNPDTTYLWGTPLSEEYVADYVSDRASGEVMLSLTPGEHRVTVYLRESRTRLDKLALELFEPISRGEPVCDGLAREAEDGLLTGSFRVNEDSAASGGGYISVPNGAGSDWQSPSDYHKAHYCFTVAEDGEYVIAANVYGTNNGEDSFFVRIDDDADRTFLWDTLINDGYAADYVSNRNGADPETVNLTAGEHTVTIYVREDGTRLDTLALEPATAEQLIAAADSLNNPGELMAHGVYGEIVVRQNAMQADDGQDFGGFSLALSGADYSRTADVMADGTYSFDNMPVGEYALRLTVPDGYTMITPAELTVTAQADSAVRVSPEVRRLSSIQRLFVPFMTQ